MNSRVLLAVALLAFLGLAYAGGKATPKPKPEPKPAPKKPTTQEWCDKSTPPKCGNWANDKKVCSNTCANGGSCSLKPAVGKPKAGAPAPAGQCCTCRTQFDSSQCICGGTTGTTATFCSSSTPAATNTCIGCQSAICAAVCDYNFNNDPDLTSPYTYDGSLPLLNANAASCAKTSYTCGSCPCSACGGTDAAATFCSAAVGTCSSCQTAVCDAVFDFNFNNDPATSGVADIDTTQDYAYSAAALTLLNPKAASCPEVTYTACGTSPCDTNCGGTDAAATYCTAADGSTCSSCQDTICASVCAFNAANDPANPPNTPDIDLSGGTYTYDGTLALTNAKAASCPINVAYTCAPCA